MTITPKERTIFRLLAEGHSRESAAANMGITYRTIKNYIVTARLKTAMTTEQLVAKVAVEDYKRGLRNSAPKGVPRI